MLKRRKVFIVKYFESIFAAFVVLIGGYGLFTKNYTLEPFMDFFLGLLILVVGMEEFRKKKREQAGYVLLLPCFH